MPASFLCCMIHVVFSTKERKPSISDGLKPELYAFICSIAETRSMKVIAIGGVSDHVHILLSMNATMSISDTVRVIKAVSSKWINEMKASGFSWQRSYSAFSVSPSQKQKVMDYIERQEEHHKKFDFRGELLELLRRHGVPFDPRFI